MSEPNRINGSSVSLLETGVALTWHRPEGNLNFYLVMEGNNTRRTESEGIEFNDLKPGKHYIFKIVTGVNGSTTWSDESTIETYTSRFITKMLID